MWYAKSHEWYEISNQTVGALFFNILEVGPALMTMTWSTELNNNIIMVPYTTNSGIFYAFIVIRILYQEELFKWWYSDKSLGLRDLFFLWSQVRALWLLIWWSLEAWRLTWSLTSGPVGLVEVRASWPGYPR